MGAVLGEKINEPLELFNNCNNFNNFNRKTAAI
jgi:hypothetical protein